MLQLRCFTNGNGVWDCGGGMGWAYGGHCSPAKCGCQPRVGRPNDPVTGCGDLFEGCQGGVQYSHLSESKIMNLMRMRC